jgi:hypothetical protein
VLASLRMNCRGILVCGEVRGAEAGAIIAVMPSYRAVWLTVHGTSPIDGLERLVAAAQMGGTRPPSPFSGGRQEHLVRRNLAAGLQLIVQMDHLADDRIVVAGVYWLEGLGDEGQGWNLMPIFQVRQHVEAGELTVDWEASPSFCWPDEVAARLAMAEIQAGSLDEAAFQAELATAQAALEGNQAAEAGRRLSNLYGLAPGDEGRRAILSLLRQALLAQPARWEALLDGAREMRGRLGQLVEERDWVQAGQILETAEQDPGVAVALEQVGIEDLHAQVTAGVQALAALARARDRAARLAEAGQHWEALSVLTGLPLEKLSAGTAGQVVETQAGQLAALQARADAGMEEAGRVARTILRLLPQTHEGLRAWAERHLDGSWQAEVEVPDELALTRRLTPLPGNDGQRQALYTQACLALSTGDRAQARQLLQQVGSYRAAQRLLQNMGE